MEQEFIPYEQALALKELGFDEPCFAQWNDSNGFDGFGGSYKNSHFNRPDQVALPLYQQAFRWFREKYKLNSLIIDSISYSWYFNINNMQIDDVVSEVLYFKSYEEAELECLKKLIEICKKNLN